MRKSVLFILITITMFNLFGKGSKSDNNKEFKKISSKIFPIIKVESADNKNSENQNIDLLLEGNNQPVFKSIAGDLLCFYGIDRGSHFELILKKQLPEDITTEQLDKFAHDNLLKTIGNKTQIHKTKFGGIGFSCGGEHEAALITLPEIWVMVQKELGDSIVFSVPSKDLILFVSSEKQSEIESLKTLIEEVHKEGGRLLSKQLFTYKNGKIEVMK